MAKKWSTVVDSPETLTIYLIGLLQTPLQDMIEAELQIRGGIEDNSKIIFLNSQ